jgi:hypothetical protein
MNIAHASSLHALPLHFPGVVQFKAPGSRARIRSGAVAHRPLRVLHVVEPGQTSPQMGRLVISGRMADVCAELDRLAAFEHTH